MADDRLFIACKKCGEKVMLGKWLACTFGTEDNREKIDEFLSHHLLMCDGAENYGLKKGADLPIVFETEQDY